MPKKKQKYIPPTVITLTLPTPDADDTSQEATLLIQRGDLAHLRQFDYSGEMTELVIAIRQASEALTTLEAQPPVIPDAPTSKSANNAKNNQKSDDSPAEDEEPTIDVPLKKGTKAIRISRLKIVGGESDAVAYKQAAIIAGRLIDGGLWDGESPIRIDDVYAVSKKMKPLTDKDFSLFSLEDFVQVGSIEEEAPASTADADEEVSAS
ncbi:MAG: hypothetical protein H6670_11025 [Anaerolineaceae bacterium]|nr:hypothetical protein [Anaerolineaceae bacterium]